jgi:hypothetical protein
MRGTTSGQSSMIILRNPEPNNLLHARHSACSRQLSPLRARCSACSRQFARFAHSFRRVHAGSTVPGTFSACSRQTHGLHTSNVVHVESALGRDTAGWRKHDRLTTPPPHPTSRGRGTRGAQRWSRRRLRSRPTWTCRRRLATCPYQPTRRRRDRRWRS